MTVNPRVVVVTPHMPPIIGGIATFSRELVTNLRLRGIQCWAFARQGASTGDWEVIPGRSMAFVWRVLLHLIRIRPDVVHAHSHWYTLLPGGLYRILRPRTRLVFTFHTKAVSRSSIVVSLFRMLLSSCSAVTYVCRDLSHDVEPIVEIPRFITYPAPEEQVLAGANGGRFSGRYGLEGRTIVTFDGPLVWPLKVEGVRRLIESFMRVANRHPDSALLIVGDGPLRIDLEKYAEKPTNGRIIFTGSIEDVGGAISAASIYAHISLQEGLPISLLNAMALGKAILASSTGGIPEAIKDGENGILVESDIASVVDGLDRLLSNSDLRRVLGEAAVESARSRFTWSRTLDQFLLSYGVTE